MHKAETMPSELKTRERNESNLRKKNKKGKTKDN